MKNDGRGVVNTSKTCCVLARKRKRTARPPRNQKGKAHSMTPNPQANPWRKKIRCLPQVGRLPNNQSSRTLAQLPQVKRIIRYVYPVSRCVCIINACRSCHIDLLAYTELLTLFSDRKRVHSTAHFHLSTLAKSPANPQAPLQPLQPRLTPNPTCNSVGLMHNKPPQLTLTLRCFSR